MKTIYSISFLLGMNNWKISPTPDEILRSTAALTPGRALDLGCGEGDHSIALAKTGWNVTGVDFVSRAIQKAQINAKRAGVSPKTQFLVGDVTALAHLGLEIFNLAFDIGCFHLLNETDRSRYISGLAGSLAPGGVFILNAFSPRSRGKKSIGFEIEEISGMFGSFFELTRTSDHTYWRFPANWYWFKRK